MRPNRAKAQTRIGDSCQLASLSVAERDSRFDRSLLWRLQRSRLRTLSRHAKVFTNPFRQDRGLTSFLHINEGYFPEVAFSPDGKDHRGRILRQRRSGRRGALDLGHTANDWSDEPLPVKERFVTSVAFSPDGKTIAAGFFGNGGVGGVVLWDLAARTRLGVEPLP